MTPDVLRAVAANAAFWTGIALLVRRSPGHGIVGRVLAIAVVGFCAVVLSLEVLGAMGLIRPAAVTAICYLTGVLGVLRWWTDAAPDDTHPGHPCLVVPARRRESVLSLVALGLAAWAALLYLLLGVVFPVEPVSDAPIYHLPFAARWTRSGWLELVATPFGEEGATYFPANGDLWLTWLMSTGATALAPAGQWPFLVLGATALYGLARRAGAPWPPAVLPAALWVGMPLTLTQSSVANIDLIWAAFYLVAVYFVLQWLDGPDAAIRAPLYLCALASGIVAGTKTIGAVLVAVLFLPVVVALARSRPSPHRLALLILALLVPSAYWYGRNVWLTGNPLYPLQLSLFGHVWADGWYGRAAMEATAYHLPVTAWRAFGARLWLVAGGIGLTLALTGVVAGGVLALRSYVEPVSRRALAMCSSLAIAHAAVYWFVSPYNTQERFLAAGLGLALVPLAIVAAMEPLAHVALCLLLAWQLAVTRHGGAFTLLRLEDNPLAIGAVWAPLFVPAAITVAAVALTWAPRARGMTAGIAIVLGCYASARPASTWLAEHPPLQFYPRSGFAARLFPGWEILERAASPAGSRIAYAGTNLPYYLLGTGLRNEVHYVNIDGRPEWLPHDYHRDRRRHAGLPPARDPWPQWYRANADFAAWDADLRRRGVEFLFIARENRHGRLEDRPGELPPFPIEKAWADAHPERFTDLGPFRLPSDAIPWVRVYRVISE